MIEVPEGYVLVGIDALKAWGKYEEVRDACRVSTAPQASGVQQEPLTDEQIREAVNGAEMMFTATDIKVARAIEAAHGINSVSE